MLNNNRVQRYNKKMTLKREKTKKSQMPEADGIFILICFTVRKNIVLKSR